MLNITITTSMQTVSFGLNIAGITDDIELHYSQCEYGNEVFRKERILSRIGTSRERKFCCKKCRDNYSAQGIAKTLTPYNAEAKRLPSFVTSSI